MVEVVTTLVVFVVGGGLFIFWPDITTAIAKPKKAKKIKSIKESIRSIYEKHYTAEDELIEGFSLAGSKASALTMQLTMQRLKKRGEGVITLLNKVDGDHRCPLCGHSNEYDAYYGHFVVRCTCDNGQFRQKVSSMKSELYPSD